MGKWDEGLKYAEQAVLIRPDLDVGYLRRATALHELARVPIALLLVLGPWKYWATNRLYSTCAPLQPVRCGAQRAGCGSKLSALP